MIFHRRIAIGFRDECLDEVFKQSLMQVQQFTENILVQQNQHSNNLENQSEMLLLSLQILERSLGYDYTTVSFREAKKEAQFSRFFTKVPAMWAQDV